MPRSPLAKQDGRRVVLVFTDGVDNPMNFKTNNLTLMDVMLRAQQENVMESTRSVPRACRAAVRRRRSADAAAASGRWAE